MAHSLVSLLARALPRTRASTLKRSTHTIRTAAVPQTMTSFPGEGSILSFQMWTARVSAGLKMFQGLVGLAGLVLAKLSLTAA